MSKLTRTELLEDNDRLRLDNSAAQAVIRALALGAKPEYECKFKARDYYNEQVGYHIRAWRLGRHDGGVVLVTTAVEGDCDPTIEYDWAGTYASAARRWIDLEYDRASPYRERWREAIEGLKEAMRKGARELGAPR